MLKMPCVILSYDVLVYVGGCDRELETGRLLSKQTLVSHSSRGWKSKSPRSRRWQIWDIEEIPLLVPRTLSAYCVGIRWTRDAVFGVSFMMTLISSMGTLTIRLPSNGPTTTCHPFGGQNTAYEFGRNTETLASDCKGTTTRDEMQDSQGHV